MIGTLASMNAPIPSADAVRERLQSMSARDVVLLARRSSVPLPTIYKIRNGQTRNPRIDTVREIWPLMMVEDAPVAA